MTMRFEEVMELISTRRSVRSFSDRDVNDADIEKMLNAACWAPSAGNSQNWRFAVIRERSVKDAMLSAVTEIADKVASGMRSSRARREFSSYSGYYTFFASAPVVIAVIKEPYLSIGRRLMEKFGGRDMPNTYSDVQGPSAAIQNMLLAAHSMGISGCWMTGPLIAKEELERVLDIRRPDELLALVPVGYPKDRLPKAAARKTGRVYYPSRVEKKHNK